MQLATMTASVLVIVMYLLRCGVMPEELNERPIIGILAQEVGPYEYPEEKYASYIAASYVKAVEASGARVVPILIGKPRNYYKNLIGKINGVLFPGGDVEFNDTNGYADAGRYIYEYAIELNDHGDHFPIFAICLGLQFLIHLAGGSRFPENKERCHAVGNTPITLTQDFRSGKMFRDANEDSVYLLENDNITIHYHHYCICDENMKRYNLTANWQVTSHSLDNYGLKHIASLEHKRYPFYAVQFHPEKTMFEWKPSEKYVHSLNAIRVNSHFIDFFVQECKNNTHSFCHEKEENGYLIYNYNPYFTGAHKEAGLGYHFDQCYFFQPIDSE